LISAFFRIDCGGSNNLLIKLGGHKGLFLLSDVCFLYLGIGVII
jgi:hypothetical protein